MAEELIERNDYTPPTDAPRRRRLLIVEDDDALARMLDRWVRDHYQDTVEVYVAHTVDEGMALLRELPTLEFVLLDRNLPEGAGDDLLDTIRSRFDPIVIMITAVEPSTELIRLPVQDYLVKPIDREALIKRLALLEKLDASGVLPAYANARKASLLEFHLPDPTADPLFRRFAARWSYDRLEAAATDDSVYVYELYLGNGEDRDPGVSVVGTVGTDLEELVEREELVPVGELVPSGNGHAWIDTDRTTVIDPPDDGYVIYAFTGDVPETYVEVDTADRPRIERELERAYE